jgi:hypothetical protein
MLVQPQNLEVNDNVAEAGVDTRVTVISALKEYPVRVNKATVSTVGL